MERFFQLSEDEKGVLNKNMHKNYVPAIIIRSNRTPMHEFTSLLRCAIKPKSLGLGVKFYRITNVDLYDGCFKARKSEFPKYVTLVQLLPEAREILLKNRNHLLKYRAIYNYADEMEMYYFNEEWKLCDALSLPICVCSQTTAKTVCEFIGRNHPNCLPFYHEGINTNKVLVSYTSNYDTISSKKYIDKSSYRKISSQVANAFEDVEMVDMNGLPFKESKEMEL